MPAVPRQSVSIEDFRASARQLTTCADGLAAAAIKRFGRVLGVIPRYSRDEMARIWKPENRYQKLLDIELAVCQAWTERGFIPS